jgi:PhzF family phenazine biosynthesis protein
VKSSAEGLELVSAFTRNPRQGNLAAVWLDARGLDVSAMQRVARHSGAQETVFGFPASSGTAYQVELRFFSSLRELPSCGHATVAYCYLHSLRRGLSHHSMWVKTGAGILPVSVDCERDRFTIAFKQAAPELIAALTPSESRPILEALGLSPADRLALPIEVVSTGHAKVLIPIATRDCLSRLKPDLGRLRDLSPVAGANGFFAFALSRPARRILYHGRMFAPATGVDEDPVTGNAHGPAADYLYRHGVIENLGTGSIAYCATQGRPRGRQGVVEVRMQIVNFQVQSVQIVGRAVLARER